MCRKGQVLGITLIALGIGVLLGLWMKSGLLSHCFGFGMIGIGYFIMRRK